MMARLSLLVGTLLLALVARAEVGPQACAACHRSQTRAAAHNPIAQALVPAKDSAVLAAHPELRVTIGQYHYTIRREGDRYLYQVTDGRESFEAPVIWAFGAGETGQTYMIERNGTLVETRVSYYPSLRGLNLTIGAAAIQANNLTDAIGRPLDARDTRECFGCHSTQADLAKTFVLAKAVPGVLCQNCHGSGDAHIAAVKLGRKNDGVRSFKNDGAEEISEFCGTCHRTWAQVQLMHVRGINTIRFQPYRLTGSQCYDTSDPRISCVACHNVHEPVVREASFYDAKCLACHVTNRTQRAQARSQKVCPKSARDCTTCHMPKLELPGAFAKFTDHRIRIVRTGEEFPD